MIVLSGVAARPVDTEHVEVTTFIFLSLWSLYARFNVRTDLGYLLCTLIIHQPASCQQRWFISRECTEAVEPQIVIGIIKWACLTDTLDSVSAASAQWNICVVAKESKDTRKVMPT